MDVVFFHIESIFWIRITSCRSGICAISNFKTHCLGPQEGRLLADNSRRLPGSARAVSRTRDRNCSSTTDNCRRGAAAATDALRAYCCTAEHRYYPPSHEKAETDTAHGVRARDRRGNTARSCGRRVAENRSPPYHEDSYKVTQRYTFHETPSWGVVRSRGSSYPLAYWRHNRVRMFPWTQLRAYTEIISARNQNENQWVLNGALRKTK